MGFSDWKVPLFSKLDVLRGDVFVKKKQLFQATVGFFGAGMMTTPEFEVCFLRTKYIFFGVRDVDYPRCLWGGPDFDPVCGRIRVSRGQAPLGRDPGARAGAYSHNIMLSVSLFGFDKVAAFFSGTKTARISNYFFIFLEPRSALET